MNLQKEILLPAIEKLKQANKQAASLDARLLLSHALDCSLEVLLDGNLDLPRTDLKRFDSYIARRLSGEPVSRIIGKRDFWQNTFMLEPEVFDPRPETELMVEVALSNQQDKQRILDLGTGTGCIILSILAAREGFRGIGVDISPLAVNLARKNARALSLSSRVHFMCIDWRWGFSGNFDIVTCNPPYIEDREIATLAAEVKDFDPPQALSGGADGLEAYRELATLAPKLLKKGGTLLLELGQGQAQEVAALFSQSHWQPKTYSDLNQITRILELVKLT